MVIEIRSEYGSEWAAIESVATKLGVVTARTVQNWVNRSKAESGVTSAEAEELKKLRAENRELKRANDILKSASTFFAAELDSRQR